MQKKATYRQERSLFDQIAFWAIVLHAFFLPLSTTATSILVPFILAIWLFSKGSSQRWQAYCTYPLFNPILCLLLLTIIGSLYSVGDWNTSLRVVNQMARLGMIPILAFYLQTNEENKKYVLIAFIAALIVTILATFLKVYAHVAIGHRTYVNSVFKNHIIISYFMAMGIFLLFFLYQESNKHKFLFWFCLGLIVYYLIFLNTGRIGYIMAYICLSMYAWHKYRMKGIVAILGCFSLLLIIAYFISDPFSMRINELYTEFCFYLEGKPITTIGARIDFFINSILLFLQNPLIGIGTGSFGEAYIVNFGSENTILTDNPHNQYLNNMVELGLVGLGVLCWLFYRQWKAIGKFEGRQLIFAQGIFLSFFIGCFFNSWLKNFTECHFYCLMTAYFLPLTLQWAQHKEIDFSLKSLSLHKKMD